MIGILNTIINVKFLVKYVVVLPLRKSCTFEFCRIKKIFKGVSLKTKFDKMFRNLKLKLLVMLNQLIL